MDLVDAKEQRFFNPQVTSQFLICPNPFSMDTYRGCVHRCCYCFARDLVEINNLHRVQKRHFHDVVANNPFSFKRWMERVYGKEKDFDKAETVFINNRVPVQVGALSDPCPPQELRYHTTETFLRILADYDYPVRVVTKNPEILFSVLRRIGPGMNITIGVSMISLNERLMRRLEPGAPSPRRRLDAIARITGELGYPVMVRVQPAIYPIVLHQLPALVKCIKHAGAWAFNTEGLKVRQTMTRAQRASFGPLATVRRRYKGRQGEREGIDYVLRRDLKLEYIRLAGELAGENGLTYFSSDNDPLGVGDGFQCCGTERLWDYNLLTCNLRTRAFGVFRNTELTRCKARFLNRQWKTDKTIGAYIDEAMEKHKPPAGDEELKSL